jgi:hypothetical protein
VSTKSSLKSNSLVLQRFVLLVILLLFFSYCKKKKIQHQYPEDPKSTTITPKLRLTGQWGIRQFTLNGSDIRSSLEAVYNNKYKISDVIFTYDKNPDTQQWFLIIDAANSKETKIDAFEEPDQLSIGPDNHTEYGLCKWFVTPFKFTKDKSVQWTITKLYDKDLNLILKTDTGEYKLFMQKL